MCGISGIFAYHYAANAIDRAELVRTRDHMAARGPDGAGEWTGAGGRVALAHRRLAIIDLTDAASQPMTDARGRLVVTFNGEIYNHRELRSGLEAMGHVFRTRSDTEVLLHLYARKGEAMVHDLRGMFALAIWDEERQSMLLARDPFGIKPLYYCDDGWTFRFASQVKALLAGGAIAADPDPAGQVGFYLFGSVPEPFTAWRQIQALPAGATLTVDRIGAREPRLYHSIAQVYRDAEARAGSRRKDADSADAVRQALRDSVRAHLVADVPVGAFLSAGIDSGALVGLMRDAGAEAIDTVTLAFGEFRGRPEDEAPLAEEVAQLYGTRHTTRLVTEAELVADLPRIMAAMDQPSIDGINTWFVSKAARERGLKVAISGLGGDELFGGYPSFRDIPRWVGLLGAPARVPLIGPLLGPLLGPTLGPTLGKAARLAAQPLAAALGASPKVAGMLELGGTYAGAYLLRRGLFMPWELGRLLDPEVVAEGLRRLAPLSHIARTLEPAPRAPQARVATLESALYMRNQLLRDTDWASMAHGLEVRVPLVDPALLGTVANADAAMPRSAPGVAKSALALSPGRPLPEPVLSRAKTGFATPIGRWLQNRSLLAAALPGEAGPPAAHWSRQWARHLAVA